MHGVHRRSAGRIRACALVCRHGCSAAGSRAAPLGLSVRYFGSLWIRSLGRGLLRVGPSSRHHVSEPASRRHGMARPDRGSALRSKCGGPGCGESQDMRLDHTSRERERERDRVPARRMAFQNKLGGICGPAFILPFLGGWRWSGCSSMHTGSPPSPAKHELAALPRGQLRASSQGTSVHDAPSGHMKTVPILMIFPSNSPPSASQQGGQRSAQRGSSKNACGGTASCQQASLSGCGAMAWSGSRQRAGKGIGRIPWDFIHQLINVTGPSSSGWGRVGGEVLKWEIKAEGRMYE